MLELIRSELFGTGTGSPFQYGFALLLIIYPFLSLPLLYHFFSRERNKEGVSAGLGFRRGRARKEAVTSRLMDKLERGRLEERIEAASCLAKMGVTEALAGVERLERDLAVETTFDSGIVTASGNAASPGNRGDKEPAGDTKELRPSNIVEFKQPGCGESATLIDAARLIILAPQASEELRRAAVDFLTEKANASFGRSCRRKKSLNEPSSAIQNLTSCSVQK